MVIGKTRLEGIDWVQDQLGVSRPLAEQTYFALERQGILIEGESDISLSRRMHGTELRQVAVAEDVIKRNNSVRSQVSKRNHSPSQKRGRYMQMKQGNSIDCSTDEIYN